MKRDILIKKIGFCCFLFFTGIQAIAQHCPYDGMYLVVVHVPGMTEQPGDSKAFRINEIENNEAGNCYIKSGLLQKKLLPVKDLIKDSLNFLSKGDVIKEFCSDCAFLGAGYYAVKLTQQERYCMLYDSSNNLERRLRKFEVCLGNQKASVPPEQVYRLCWTEGSWNRIQPVEIKSRVVKRAAQ